MNLLVTGSHGLVGSRLVPELRRAGHEVVRAVRHAPATSGEVRWDPESGALTPAARFDAVIYLAGVGLASGRWTPELKRRAWASRVGATHALCTWLSRQSPPRVMLCASAIGIYGDRGDEPLDESSSSGRGYLADLAQAWETSSDPLRKVGTRVVHLRLGLVLAREGGALPALVAPARWGLGGPLGSGRQFWSWVAIDDVVRIFVRALARPELAGPVNVVAPVPVPQRDFARTLGAFLRRPALLPAPAWALRLLLGEMADATLLASARVFPRRLLEDGFVFEGQTLGDALRATLETCV